MKKILSILPFLCITAFGGFNSAFSNSLQQASQNQPLHKETRIHKNIKGHTNVPYITFASADTLQKAVCMVFETQKTKADQIVAIKNKENTEKEYKDFVEFVQFHTIFAETTLYFPHTPTDLDHLPQMIKDKEKSWSYDQLNRIITLLIPTYEAYRYQKWWSILQPLKNENYTYSVVPQITHKIEAALLCADVLNAISVRNQKVSFEGESAEMLKKHRYTLKQTQDTLEKIVHSFERLNEKDKEEVKNSLEQQKKALEETQENLKKAINGPLKEIQDKLKKIIDDFLVKNELEITLPDLHTTIAGRSMHYEQLFLEVAGAMAMGYSGKQPLPDVLTKNVFALIVSMLPLGTVSSPTSDV